MKGLITSLVVVPFCFVMLIGVGVYSVVPSVPPSSDDQRTQAQAPGAGVVVADTDAAPFTGTSTGCTETDPTTAAGCLTPAMAWLHVQLDLHFGDLAEQCWDPHLWNPSSDHPQGKACDISIGIAGQFPDDAGRAHGWEIADWLRANASALDVSYVIWDGKIWSVSRDDEGWRTYTGGGVYDVTTATGGHYDHVHVSTRS